MTQSPTEHLDDTGKAVFDDLYHQPDPRKYYEHLGQLGYRIAGEAQPLIARTISALSGIRDEQPKVIDIGSSYGINAALLNSDLTLDQLDRHYRTNEIAGWSRDRVLERDITYFSDHQADQCSDIVGIDVSRQALQYAVDAGLLDAALAVNLEEESLGPDEAALLSGADLVMSTGAVGYVSEATFEQVVDATRDSRPWVANSVLRMFPYDGFIELLAERGYVTEKSDTTLIQRAFASDEERANVLENLGERGLDPAGKEAEGHYHADFYLSRPREDADTAIFERVNPTS